MKTLLACLTSRDHAEDVLNVCLPLAGRHDSHLIGLHTIQKLALYPGITGHVPVEVYTNFSDAQEAESEAIRELFEVRTAGETTPCEWRAVVAESMTAADRMVEAAHAADLVVMGQADEAVDQSNPYHAQEHVIRRSGRPVLHVPKGWRGGAPGRSVVIGWSPTREAARAVHDALPLLSPGAEVAVVTIGSGASAGFQGATEMARALDRHGYGAEVIQRNAPKGEIAAELGQVALERGADLLVTGAFGHSRLYDFVVGAVTLEVMRNAELPVLFSR